MREASSNVKDPNKNSWGTWERFLIRLGALPRYFTVEEIAEERDVIRVLVTRCIEQLRTQDRREKEVNVLSTDNR
jgi:hypothetical protein